MSEIADEPAEPRSGLRVHIKLIAAVLAIMVVALGVRLGYVLTLERGFRFPDEEEYFDTAEQVRSGAGVVQKANELEIQRAPGYPLFLAVIMRISPSFTLIRVLQAIVGALTVGAIFALTRELLGNLAALIAAGIAAIYPFFVFFTGLVLSETLFLFLFVASFYLLVYAWKSLARGGPRTEWVGFGLMAGLFAALSVLTRPEALPVYGLVPVVWLIAGPHRLKGLGVSLLLVLAMFVGMSPWIARNYKRTQFREETAPRGMGAPGETPTGAPAGEARVSEGHLVLTTLKVGESLYEAVGPFANGGPHQLSGAFLGSSLNEYEKNQWLLDHSWLYIKNNPERILRLGVIKLLRTWNVVPNWKGARAPFFRIVSMIGYIPVMLTAGVGLFVAGVRRPRVLAWVLLPILVITGVHTLFVGSIRYRLPMMPFVMILSGAGVAFIIEKLFHLERRTDNSQLTTDK